MPECVCVAVRFAYPVETIRTSSEHFSLFHTEFSVLHTEFSVPTAEHKIGGHLPLKTPNRILYSWAAEKTLSRMSNRTEEHPATPKEESVRLRKASCNVFIGEESTKRQALYGIHGKSDFSILIIIAIHRSRIIVKQIGCNLAA